MSSNIKKDKFLIVTTVPGSLHFFKGQVGVLKSKFDISVVSSPLSGLKQFSELEKVKAHEINMSREISAFKDFKSLLKFIKLFIKIKPKIVHGNTPKGALLSMIAGWLTRVPCRIYCVHGLRYQGSTGLKRRLLIGMEYIACSLATNVYSVSFGVKKALVEDGICNKKINVIWNGSANGIDISRFSLETVDDTGLRMKYNLKPDDFVFGFVGRIVKDKGINELIEAFVKVNKKYKHAKLLLIGKYEDLDPIKEETNIAIKTNKNIIYAGFQKEIKPFLKMMNVFVFPTYREGLATSLLEASAMSKAIISTDATGCYEVIKDGYNGRVIPVKSKTKLRDAMIELIENPLLVQKFSAESRKSIIERYEQEEFWKKALESYTKIIENV